MEFYNAVKNRRAVRKFTRDKIPDAVFNRVISAALLAPNSSNLQLWRFIRIKSDGMKEKTARIALDQPAARTASEFIAVIATPSLARKNAKRIHAIAKTKRLPEQVLLYYQHIVPLMYLQLFNAFGFLKWVILTIVGIFRPVPRGPFSKKEVELIAVKSASLAAENIMLALSAEGYDSCPMEGFDEWRLKRILKLSWSDRVVMLIACGKRAPGGIYTERIRFPSSEVFSEV